jgi:hypothetical protein
MKRITMDRITIQKELIKNPSPLVVRKFEKDLFIHELHKSKGLKI